MPCLSIDQTPNDIFLRNSRRFGLKLASMPLLNANGRADLQTSRVFRRKRKAVCLLVIILGLVTGASEKATCQEPTTAADQKSELEEAERLSQKAKNLSREYEY